MKKSILLFSLLLIVFSSKSQVYANLDIYCQDIRIAKDDMTGETRYTTPFEKEVSFKKICNNGKEATYMTLSAKSNLPTIGKGIEIYLDQANRIVKKEVVTNVYEVGENQYVHYCEFLLSKDDISKLRNYNIANFKVYVYPSAVENTLQYKGYIYCLKNAH